MTYTIATSAGRSPRPDGGWVGPVLGTAMVVGIAVAAVVFMATNHHQEASSHATGQAALPVRTISPLTAAQQQGRTPELVAGASWSMACVDPEHRSDGTIKRAIGSGDAPYQSWICRGEAGDTTSSAAVAVVVDASFLGGRTLDQTLAHAAAHGGSDDLGRALAAGSGSPPGGGDSTVALHRVSIGGLDGISAAYPADGSDPGGDYVLFVLPNRSVLMLMVIAPDRPGGRVVDTLEQLAGSAHRV